MALRGIMNQRMTSDLQVRRLAAVVGCIREVAGVPDDAGMVVDGVSTVFNITQVSDLRFLWFVLSARVYEFTTASSFFKDALRSVEGTTLATNHPTGISARTATTKTILCLLL